MKTIQVDTLLILVIDDEADTRNGCERILSRMGYQVRTAASGAEGLQIVTKDPVSIWVTKRAIPVRS